MKAKYVEIEVGKAYDLWCLGGERPVIVTNIKDNGLVDVVDFWTKLDYRKYPWLIDTVFSCNLHPLTYHELPWFVAK